MTFVKLEAGNSHFMNKRDDFPGRLLLRVWKSTGFWNSKELILLGDTLINRTHYSKPNRSMRNSKK